MKIKILITLLLISYGLSAQILDPKEIAKRKAESRANRKIDNTIDKSFDKLEEGIGSIFKKKDKSKNDEKGEESTNKNSEDKDQTSIKKPSVSTQSKYDFVPGNKELYLNNFGQVKEGDFPDDINTNGSGEVMTIEGLDGKWLAMTNNGVYIFEAIKNMPDNATLQFDIGYIGEALCNESDGFGLKFYNEGVRDRLDYTNGDGSYIFIQPGGCPSTKYNIAKDNKNVIGNHQELTAWNGDMDPFAKVELWKQNGRLRAYINQEKVWDIPRFFTENAPYKALMYHSFQEDVTLLISNIRLAEL